MAASKTLKKDKTKGSVITLVAAPKRVPIKSLKPHPRNPNVREDLTDIMDSIVENGIYKPIVVQRSTKHILVNNHVWLAMRKLGETEIDASFIDVDDDKALRILLADNATGKRADIDARLVADILKDLPDAHVGTGYTQEETDEFLASLREDAAKAGKSIEDFTSNMPDSIDTDDEPEYEDPRDAIRRRDSEDEDRSESKRSRGAHVDSTKTDTEVNEIDPDVLVSAELQATLELKEDQLFDGEKYNEWGIPQLRKDMLLDKLPTLDIKTWAGADASPDDGKRFFIYNYSLGGVRGLPYDRSILSFFTHDSKFDNWWEMPAYYTAKLLTAGTTIAIAPDYSFYYTEKRIHHLWGVWKSMWLARFFQEAGMKVIPRLQFDYKDPKSLEIALLGIPRGAPVLATSQQNIERGKEGDEQSKAVTAMLKEALQELKPKQLLYYSGPPGRRAMEAVKWKGEIVYVENYAAVRRGAVFDKKEGAANPAAKDRVKALRKARKEAAKKSGDQRSKDQRQIEEEDED